jgi:hypothetical protein
MSRAMAMPRVPHGVMFAKLRQRHEPRSKIAKVLTIPVRPPRQTAPAAKHTLDRDSEVFSLIDPPLFTGRAMQRGRQDEAEGVCPKIAYSVGPDAFPTHPVDLGKDIVEIMKHHAYIASRQRTACETVPPAVKRGTKGRHVTFARRWSWQ